MPTLEILPGAFALVRLPRDAAVPPWTVSARRFVSVTRTDSELSILADAEVVPRGLAVIDDWRGLRVAGTLPLDSVGVLAPIARALAEAGVAIFPVATHDTDWLFVRDADLPRARAALEQAGYLVS